MIQLLKVNILETGVSGILHSTKPPITPAAWTTFMTGKGPGLHGIVDFEKYHVATHELSFNSTYEIREQTIWELLSKKGLKVGSVNVPADCTAPVGWVAIDNVP